MQSAAESARALSERQWTHREATLVKQLETTRKELEKQLETTRTVLEKEVETTRKELEMTREALASESEQGLAWQTHIASLENARSTLTEELDLAREQVRS